MKRFFSLIAGALALISFYSIYGQEANQLASLSERSPEKLNILRASLALHETEENLFWPLYDQYELQLNELKNSSMTSLKRLTIQVPESASLNGVKDHLLDQQREAALKKEYFDKILASTNGTIALQFLQGEALYDLFLKSRLYETFEWDHPAWSAQILTDENFKRSVLEDALAVSLEDTTEFRAILSDYEFEYSRVVGHEFVFFQQYVDNAEDWSPGQCKRLGSAFIAMQQNEVKVKDRFSSRLSDSFGPSFATQFFSIQEYFNTMAKLKVWSDNVSISTASQR